jgi:hypothetical protein
LTAQAEDQKDSDLLKWLPMRKLRQQSKNLMVLNTKAVTLLFLKLVQWFHAKIAVVIVAIAADAVVSVADAASAADVMAVDAAAIAADVVSNSLSKIN